jgi:dipeptidase E
VARKRRLVFYSGGQNKSNNFLHERLADLKGKRARSLTYIPFSHENGEYYFKRIKKRYSRYGIKKFRYFPVDSDFLAKEMREALKSDIIYLAGGNTYYFLKHLRESGFLKRLEKFVKRGGVLAGLSAGAIIMTPHIHMAGYPEHEGDINEVRLKNFHALNLVEFEFLPHYSASAKTHQAMLRYSRRSKLPIVACPDGSGVVIDGDKTEFIGLAYIYYRGHRFKLG